MAFVILHPGKAAKWENKHKNFETDLKAHAKKRLPGFATPEWVVIVPDLPVGGTFEWVGPLHATDSLEENFHRKDSKG